MAKEKKQGFNGLLVGMLQEYWNIIGNKFCRMIQNSAAQARHDKRYYYSNFQSEDRQQLINWRPITL